MKALVARYQGSLFNFFVKRSRNSWDAEELTQEVFCKILKGKDIDTHQNPEAYLFAVAWSVLRDRVRREKVRHQDAHIEYDDGVAGEGAVSPERTVLAQEQFQLFLDVLDTIPPQNREMFIMNRYEGMSYAEIAKHFCVSMSTVEKRMMKTLAHMKEVIR